MNEDKSSAQRSTSQFYATTYSFYDREESYPSKRVKVSSGLYLQANVTGRVTLSLGSTLQALLTCFVMRDILCNGPKFEITLKFSMKNTLNSRKKEKNYYCGQNITFYFSGSL